MAFIKATREKAKLKLAISGLEGSGKTMGSLLVARGVVGPQGKIAVIDTEQGKSTYYSDNKITKHISYDVDEIKAPFTSQKYLACIKDAVNAGYDFLIIDSISHEWDGPGGIKDQKDAIDARGGNSFTNWGKVKPLHDAFIHGILTADIHIICTMRCKSDMILEMNDRGKQAPKKVGLKAIQREGVEYEFDLMFDMAHNKTFSVSKDRTGLFDGRFEMLSEDIGRELGEWLSTAAPATARPQAPVVEQPKPSIAAAQLINLDQETEIADLVTESKADIDAFLKAYNVSCYAHLTQEQYLSARRKLKQKIDDSKAA